VGGTGGIDQRKIDIDFAERLNHIAVPEGRRARGKSAKFRAAAESRVSLFAVIIDTSASQAMTLRVDQHRRFRHAKHRAMSLRPFMLFQVLDSIEHCVMFGFGRDDMTRLRRAAAAGRPLVESAPGQSTARLHDSVPPRENNFTRF